MFLNVMNDLSIIYTKVKKTEKDFTTILVEGLLFHVYCYLLVLGCIAFFGNLFKMSIKLNCVDQCPNCTVAEEKGRKPFVNQRRNDSCGRPKCGYSRRGWREGGGGGREVEGGGGGGEEGRGGNMGKTVT